MCKTQLDSFHSLLLRSTKPCCHYRNHSPGTTRVCAGSRRKIKIWENSLRNWEVTLKAVEPGCQPGATSVGAWDLTWLPWTQPGGRWSKNALSQEQERLRLVLHSDDYSVVPERLVPEAAACAQPQLWHAELSELKVQVLMLLQGGVQGGHESSTADRTLESSLHLCFL